MTFSTSLTFVISTIMLIIIRCRLTLPAFKPFLIIYKKIVKGPYNDLEAMAWKQPKKVSIYAIIPKSAWSDPS